MIVLPKRSVTRFFIPLIDVLTLLFCIFLLMPVVEEVQSASTADQNAMAEQLRHLEEQLAKIREEGGDTATLKDQVEKLRQQLGKSIKDRIAVRVLEIDGKTGALYYNDPERIEIHKQEDAEHLIERDRRERGAGSRELYYLILYPRDRNSSYPTVAQYEQYQHWFEGVALGFDIPGEITQGGPRP
jgi:sRNA-binding carbon storage regulator CsrA